MIQLPVPPLLALTFSMVLGSAVAGCALLPAPDAGGPDAGGPDAGGTAVSAAGQPSGGPAGAEPESAKAEGFRPAHGGFQGGFARALARVGLGGSRGPALPATPGRSPAGIDPRTLIGLGASQLAHRLGPPTFVRRDGPAEIWQYVSEGCVLDVYIYTQQSTPQVSYVEERSRAAAGTVDTGACFRSFQDRSGSLAS